jgi:hypothetical protein
MNYPGEIKQAMLDYQAEGWAYWKANEDQFVCI